MKHTHSHCVLRKSDGRTQVSFIPSSFAQVGRYLKLKENGEWIDGWRVDEVYPPLIPSEFVEAHSRDYTDHRKATDI